MSISKFFTDLQFCDFSWFYINVPINSGMKKCVNLKETNFEADSMHSSVVKCSEMAALLFN